MNTDTITLSSKILRKAAKIEWKKMGQTGEPPEVTSDKFREWVKPLPTDEFFKLFYIATAESHIASTQLLKEMPKNPEPDSFISKMWYRIRRCRLQHDIDVPLQTRTVKKTVDDFKHLSFEDQEIANVEEIKPRRILSTAAVAVISGWNNEVEYNTIKDQYGISSLEDGVVAIHKVWEIINDEHPDTFYHPIEPLVKQFLQDMCVKNISREYDRTHPAAVLKHPLGSIQDINFNGSETARLREFATPKNIEPMQAAPFENESLLPNVLPLDVAHPLGVKPKTKSGAVPHVLRIFFEALMALEPSDIKIDISFTLGDLIHYLYPDRKFHRTNQLPYIINALEILHTYATVPFQQENGDIGRWRPVVVRNVISKESKNDTRILLDVRLPPDATQGMLVQKEIIRMLGKKSAPQFSAYLSACHLWDKYGTTHGKLIDPTQPIVNRNPQGYLVDANGNELRGRDGKRITNPYQSDAIAQLKREPNPSRKIYPILHNEDLIKACNFSKTSSNKYRDLKRAKAYWTQLEKEGIVSIDRFPTGWRIMPSDKHMKTYRAIRQAIKNSRD